MSKRGWQKGRSRVGQKYTPHPLTTFFHLQGRAKGNRTLHEKMRQRPSWRDMQLRKAVTELGLPVLGWEYEIDRGDGYPLWFKAAVQLADGRIGLIHSMDTDKAHSPLNQVAQKRRRDYAHDNNLPYIELLYGNVQSMRAMLELWLLGINRYPIRIAKTSPYHPHRQSKNEL